MVAVLSGEVKCEVQKLMRSKDVQEVLGIAKSTLHRWKQEGIIKATRIGGLDFYEESELKRLVSGESAEEDNGGAE